MFGHVKSNPLRAYLFIRTMLADTTQYAAPDTNGEVVCGLSSAPCGLASEFAALLFASDLPFDSNFKASACTGSESLLISRHNTLAALNDSKAGTAISASTSGRVPRENAMMPQLSTQHRLTRTLTACSMPAFGGQI